MCWKYNKKTTKSKATKISYGCVCIDKPCVLFVLYAIALKTKLTMKKCNDFALVTVYAKPYVWRKVPQYFVKLSVNISRGCGYRIFCHSKLLISWNPNAKSFFQSFLSFLWIALGQLLPCVFGKELSHTLASGEWSGWDCTTFVAFIWWRMSRGGDKTERPWDRFAPPGFESVQPPCILLQLHDASFHCWRHCSGGGKTERKENSWILHDILYLHRFTQHIFA